MQRTNSRISDILENLHGSGGVPSVQSTAADNDDGDNDGDVHDDDDNNNNDGGGGRELDRDEGVTIKRRNQQQRADQSASESSAVEEAHDKHDYLSVRDEAEIMLVHHLNSIKLLQTFLIDQKAQSAGGEDHDTSMARGRSDSMISEEGMRILRHDKEARKFWINRFGAKTFCVKKDAFISAMRDHFKKSTWIPELDLLVDPTSDNAVSIADLKCFLDWFGPFKRCITNATRLIEYPWFWGSLTSIKADSIMAREQVGTFLVRFHDSMPGTFYISCVQECEQHDTDVPFGLDTRGLASDGKTTLDSAAASMGASTSDAVSPAASADHFLYQRQTRVYHFNVLRKDGHFMLADGEPKYREIQHLLEQYSLTFRRPFENESLKAEQLLHLNAHRLLRGISVTALKSSSTDVQGQVPLFFAHFRGRTTAAHTNGGRQSIPSGDSDRDNGSGSALITRIDTTQPRRTTLPAGGAGNSERSVLDDSDSDDETADDHDLLEEVQPVIMTDPTASISDDENQVPLIDNV